MVKTLVCKIGQPPTIQETSNPFRYTKNNLINNGMVEIVHLDDGVDVYCDEEARLNGSIFNRSIPCRAPAIPDDIAVILMDPNLAKPGEMGVHQIYGNFLIAKFDPDTEKYVSLTDEEIKKYTKILTLKE